MPYSQDWPTEPVELNHLEAMGILMALEAEEERDGLSDPQREAKEKVGVAWTKLFSDLRKGR